MDQWPPELVASVWTSIDHNQDYEWDIEQPAVEALRLLIPNVPEGICQLDKAEANRLLRQELKLATLAPERRSEAALWIVGSWGGIRSPGDDATVPEWLAELKEFRPHDVDTFIGRMGTKRISSWSKLLAFADLEAYAIYDSWTAIALNYGLAKQKDGRRFFMPGGRIYRPVRAQRDLNRGQVRELARKVLRSPHRSRDLGYESYLRFLKQAVKLGRARDLLDAEMFLFANGLASARSAAGLLGLVAGTEA